MRVRVRVRLRLRVHLHTLFVHMDLAHAHVRGTERARAYAGTPVCHKLAPLWARVPTRLYIGACLGACALLCA